MCKFSPCYHIFIAVIDGQPYKVPHIMNDDEFEYVMELLSWKMPFHLRAFHFSNIDQLLLNRAVEAYPVLQVPIQALFTTVPGQAMKLKNKARKETVPVFRKYEDFVISHTDDGYLRFNRVDGINYSLVTRLHVQPISLAEARSYVKRHHRHCGPPKFHKFSVCLTVDGEPEPVGVVVASTPKARAQMDGMTLEINRVCSDSRNADACSKLYSLAVRAGKSLGYRRFLSYTLPSESGSSLKAAGFIVEGTTAAGAHGWNSPSRPRATESYPIGEKLRWVLKT